jgi:Flp pilus assembly protein TadD
MCYFERAARYAPDDANVPNALGILLHRADKPEEALASFQKAVELAPEAPEAHYNLGLSQFSLGRYDQAAASARRAYELGYGKQDLKIKLKRKGHWQ